MAAWREVTIVGGYGRMGRFFSRLFASDGFDVTICGRRHKKAKRAAKCLDVGYGDVEESVRKADLVVVSVPIGSTYSVCKSVSKDMREEGTLVEIASVKTGIADRLPNELPDHVRFVSIHPLFGPRVRNIGGRNLLVVRGGDSKATREVTDYFKAKGANVTLLSVEEHDRAMAAIQVLHHFALTALSRSFETYLTRAQLETLSTDSLRLTLKAIKRMAESRETVNEIQRHNPYSNEIRADFIRFLSEQAGKIVSGLE